MKCIVAIIVICWSTLSLQMVLMDSKVSFLQLIFLAVSKMESLQKKICGTHKNIGSYNICIDQDL
jgi:hypothetical protein